MQLYGKTALITGAGQGIGRATAVAFAKEGANLILADINYENAVETANQIADKNIQCWPYKLDVSDVNQINSLINFAVEKCDGIDLFFNNAGVTQHISFFDINEVQWDKINKVNAKGAFFCMQQVARLMVNQGRGGKIVNAGSIAGKGYKRASNAAYAASKGSVIAMTHIAAEYLAPHGINVNAICPGMVQTDMFKGIVSLRSEETGQEALQIKKNIESEIPLGRVNQPEDVAALVLFLVSDSSRNITGQALNIDGGMIMH
ncbi:MAG: hypothetical protein CL699_00660 [Chloroflexi bacterium]|nr:hypothetical protein [Chloroflexota bacterium]|tara:strand:+ start:3539 stop:4321 length:783 start_codon:yes stop_codon:yes gene_type:complete